MRFLIDGLNLIININGNIRSFPNTDAGYREMATAWIQGRNM